MDGAAPGVTVWLDRPVTPPLDEALRVVRFWLEEWSDLGAVTVAVGAPPPGCVTVDPGAVTDAADGAPALLRVVLDAAGEALARRHAAPAAADTGAPAAGDLEPFGAGEMAVFARLDGDPDLERRLEDALGAALDGVALLQDSTVVHDTVGQWVIGQAPPQPPGRGARR